MEDLTLLPVDDSLDHYRICKSWLEDRHITKWLTSSLRFAKYHKIIHEKLISNRKNKLFFIGFADRLLGLVGLSNIDLVDKRAEVWYLIGAKSDMGKDIATQAVSLLKDIAVQDLNLLTLYAHVSELNPASVRVLEKNGFQYAGKYRKAFFVDDSYRDFLIFDWVIN